MYDICHYLVLKQRNSAPSAVARSARAPVIGIEIERIDLTCVNIKIGVETFKIIDIGGVHVSIRKKH